MYTKSQVSSAIRASAWFRAVAVAFALAAFSIGLNHADAQSTKQSGKSDAYDFDWPQGEACARGICFGPPVKSPFDLDDVRGLAPIELGESCELSWSPSVLAPVFYGYQDHVAEDDQRLRIFYPSVDGSPPNAPMLHCGPYPIVLFLHGGSPGNSDPDHFMDWIVQPAQLARSGYVVVVPDFGSTGPAPFEGALDTLENVVDWVRNSWSESDQLGGDMAVVGHSYGALYGGRFTAAHAAEVRAFVSLSGAWKEWSNPSLTNPLSLIQQPSLFAWGTGNEAFDVETNADIGNYWPYSNIPVQHRITIEGGLHYDYLPPSLNDSPAGAGTCGLTPFVVGDFVTLFLSRYMPPPHWTYISWLIENNLMPPPMDLTSEQQFFSGGHLAGLALIPSAQGCDLTHGWQLLSEGGSETYGP